MASYAENGTACELLIEPEHSTRQPADKEQSMATGTVKEIIDELTPQSERGALPNDLIENMGAADFQEQFRSAIEAKLFPMG